jgi:hypothetical protein
MKFHGFIYEKQEAMNVILSASVTPDTQTVFLVNDSVGGLGAWKLLGGIFKEMPSAPWYLVVDCVLRIKSIEARVYVEGLSDLLIKI